MNTDEHVCAKCGESLNPVNWWTVEVRDRYSGTRKKLCRECAKQVAFAIKAVIKLDGEVGGVIMR